MVHRGQVVFLILVGMALQSEIDFNGVSQFHTDNGVVIVNTPTVVTATLYGCTFAVGQLLCAAAAAGALHML
jgi:hypothetical protein